MKKEHSLPVTVFSNLYGLHDREFLVKKSRNDCMQCEQPRICLEFDNSDDEYSDLVFCQECLNRFFLQSFVKRSRYEEEEENQKVIETLEDFDDLVESQIRTAIDGFLTKGYRPMDYKFFYQTIQLSLQFFKDKRAEENEESER